jgi:2-isopropylmalate synthase
MTGNGVAYVLKTEYDLHLPREMAADFSALVTKVSDKQTRELSPEYLRSLFMDAYKKDAPLYLARYTEETRDDESAVSANVIYNDTPHTVAGQGNGIIDAFCRALRTLIGDVPMEVQQYDEHSLAHGTGSKAITYVRMAVGKDAKIYHGVGISSNVSKSSLRAIVSAVNQAVLKL